MSFLKKQSVLIGMMLLLLTIIGCKVSPTPIPNNYEFFLELKGQNGNNLLDNFDINNLNNEIIVRSEKGEAVSTTYSIIELKNKKILRVVSSTLAGNKLDAIVYTFVNEELMSNKASVLHTKWVFSGNKILLTDFYKNNEKLSPVKEDYFNYFVLIKE